jgi:alpha-L-fucosidase
MFFSEFKEEYKMKKNILKYASVAGIALSIFLTGCEEKIDGLSVVRKEGAPSSPATRPVPSPELLRRIKSEYEVYGIVHYSLNTYTDREWGYGNEDPKLFNPSEFSADQIVKACKDGGLQGLVIVAKHHDGFCLWPTKTTEHNISKSPFRGGKGDYLREMEQACRKHGLKFGVYVSPWDRNNAQYSTQAYKQTFWKQVLEIFGGAYGDVNELWFDGANGGDGYYGGACETRKIPKNYYDFAGLIAAAKKYQKDLCAFYDWDEGDLHYPGNESGNFSPNGRMTYPARADKPTPGWEKCLYMGDINGTLFKQAECDFPMRPGWFYHDSHNGYTKSPEYLMQKYLTSAGNSATMNIGISPDKRGLLTDEDVKALKGFAEIKNKFFAIKVKSAAKPFNMIVIRENVANGEHIDGWTLSLDGKEIDKGISIGAKRIRVFPEQLSGKELKFEITAGSAKPCDVKIELFNVEPSLMKSVMDAKIPQRPKPTFELNGMPTKIESNSIVYQFKGKSKFHSVLIDPDKNNLGGTPVTFKLSFSNDGVNWEKDDTEYRLGNIAANPIAQVVKLSKEQNVRYVKVEMIKSLEENRSIAIKAFQLVNK